DQILVLEDGRPVGLGPHERLLVDCPTYAEIVASQLGQQAAELGLATAGAAGVAEEGGGS
ncbi:MAG TPA: hypothetical protein PLV68_13085, partial [Ilumatobacteraceae bacterium]|nr:hypothetical protein [Ilumatobacteraceae bacterium]